MKNIVVIGGGYGGLRAIEHLSKNKEFAITLFDQNSYHYLQTEAYGYIAGRFDLHDVALDLQNWCLGFENKVDFIQEKVTFIDTANNVVTTQTSKYDFDFCIIACGARTNFFKQIHGLEKYGYGVKQLFRSHDFRTAFEKLLYDKLLEPNVQQQNMNLAIGGAGLSGVEIAAEMADVIKRHTKSIGDHAKELKIYLIDASETILPGMSPYVIKNTRNRLEELGIKIMTKSFISSIDQDTIHFQDQSQLNYTFMIFTGGIIANTIQTDQELKLNHLGQYICDDTLRICENIFTVGDCVELKDKYGEMLPPTAQTAERSAEYVAKTINQLCYTKAIKQFQGKVDGVFVALGGYYAVGELFRYIKVKGKFAYLLKKLITKSYYIGLKLRLNTGFIRRSKLEEE